MYEQLPLFEINPEAYDGWEPYWREDETDQLSDHPEPGPYARPVIEIPTVELL